MENLKKKLEELDVDDENDLHEKIIQSFFNNDFEKYKDELSEEQFIELKKEFNEIKNAETQNELYVIFEKYKVPKKEYANFKTEILSNGIEKAWNNYYKKIPNKYLHDLKRELDIFDFNKENSNLDNKEEPSTTDANQVDLKDTTKKKNIYNLEFSQKLVLINEFSNKIINQNWSRYEFLFNDVNYINLDETKEIIEKNPNNLESVFAMLKYFVTCLKQGKDYLSLFKLSNKNKESLSYGIDETTLIILIFEKFSFFEKDLILYLQQMARPIPISYLWYDGKNYKFKINLKAFSDQFSYDNPFILSVGEKCIGKSTLMNKIFETSFDTKKFKIFSNGADITLHSEEFATGFNIIDVRDEFVDTLVECLLKILIPERFWVLLQVVDVNKINIFINKLTAFGVPINNINVIVRDSSSIDYKNIEINKNQIIGICDFKDDEFDSSIDEIKEFIFNRIGIGKTRKIPETYKIKFNGYLDLENRVNLNKFEAVTIQLNEEEYKKLNSNFLKFVSDFENLKEKLFPHLFCIYQIHDLEKNKKIDDMNEEIEKIYKKKSGLQIPHLIEIYKNYFESKNFDYIKELCRLLNFYQQPFIDNLLSDKIKYIKDFEEKKKKYQIEASELKKFDIKIKEFSNDMDKVCVGGENFLRELVSMYSDKIFCEKNNSLNYNCFIDALGDYLLAGNEVEIIDGDYNTFNQDIFKDLFSKLNEKIKDILVISVIGPQSTGKSTLLNKLFNTNFKMSAGRCTKGLYASIKKVCFKNKQKFALILDTEGLLSIEKGNEEFDKQLTLFSMACSHVVVINVNGEINNAMKKILLIALYASTRIQALNHKPIIYFVLRNMNDLNINKQSEMITGIENALKEVSKLSNVEFESILDYQGQNSFILTMSAFDKDFIRFHDKPIFEIIKSKSSFSDIMNRFREDLFNINLNANSDISKLSSWSTHAASVWKSIRHFNDFFMYDSIKEIEERDELTKIQNDLIKNKIEPEIKNLREKYLNEIQSKFQETNSLSKLKRELTDEVDKFKNEIKTEIENNDIAKKITPDLVKEYIKRLESLIDSRKDEIEDEMKKINVKFSIETLVKTSLLKIETKATEIIFKWQDQKGNDTEDTIKNKLKQELENEIKNTEDQFNNKLKDFEKTTENIGKEVYDLFSQVKTQLNTQDNYLCFNSLRNFKNSCEKNYKNPFFSFGKKQNLNSNTKIENDFSNYFYEIHYDKNICTSSNNKNKIKNKINNIIRTVINLFSNSSNSNNIPEEQNQILLKTKCIAAFEQIYIFVYNEKDGIIKEILNLNEAPNTNILKGYISKLDEKIDSININLKNEGIELNRLKVEEDAVEIIFIEIRNRLKKLNEKEIEETKHEFNNKKNQLKDTVIKNFDQQVNELTKATNLINDIKKNIHTYVIEQSKKHLHNLLNEAELTPNEFQNKCDEVFKSTNADDIFNYINDSETFMNKIFDKHFKDILEKKVLIVKSEFEKNLKKEFENLKSELEYVQKELFFEIQASSNVNIDREIYDLLKYFLMQNKEINKTLEEVKKKLNNENLFNGYNSNCHKFSNDIARCLFDGIVGIIITNPKTFCNEMIKNIEIGNKDYVLGDLTKTDSSHINTIKVNLYEKSRGCSKRCPYCGVKCDENTPQHEFHKADHHWLMAFRGSFYYNDNAKKEFVFDICNSSDNIKKSKWKENIMQKDIPSAVSDPSFRERIKNYNLTYGKLTFTLIWNDRNDLDLHVVCPCGKHIYYCNKKCDTCNGYLEKDMNICYCDPECDPKATQNKQNGCSKKPIEHIYFNNDPPVGKYEVSVNFFRHREMEPTTSTFKLQITEENGKVLNEFNQTIEKGQTNKIIDFYTSKPISFLEHVQKTYNEWKNIREESDPGTRIHYENNLKRSWKLISSKMATKYEYNDNTPKDW